MPVSKEDHDFLVSEIKNNWENLSPSQRDRAMNLIEEYRGSQGKTLQEMYGNRGAKQTVIESTANTIGGASTIAAGFGDWVLGMAEAVTDLIPGIGDAPAEALSERRNEIKAGAAEINKGMTSWAFGRPLSQEEQEEITSLSNAGVDAVSMLSKIGAGVAGGAAAVGAKTAKGALGIATTEGAITGALLGEVDPNSEKSRIVQRLTDAGMGAGIGFATGTVPMLFAGGKNLLNHWVKKAAEGEDAAEAAKLFDEFGIFNRSLGQESGNPVILNIEQNAKGRHALEMFRNQSESLPYTIAAKAGVRLRPLSEIGEEGADDLVRAVGKMENEIYRLKGVRNEEWRKATAALNARHGGAEVLSSKGLTDEALDISRQFAENPEKYGIQPWALKMLDKLSDGSNLTIKELGDLQVDLNMVKQGQLKLFESTDYRSLGQTLAGRLSKALKATIDQAPDSPALRDLRAIRESYEQASKYISQVEGDTLTALGFSGDPSATLNMLQKAPPKVARSAMRLLDRLDGGAIFKRDLEAAVFDEAVMQGMRAASGTADRVGDLDLQAFTKALSQGTRRSVLAGISPPEREKIVQNGLVLARKILNDPDAVNKAGVLKTQLGVDIPGAMINLIERHPGFVARWLGGAVTRGKGADWLFFTQDGQKILRNLGNERISGMAVSGPATVRNAAILYINDVLKAGANEEMEQQKQAASQ